MIPVMFRGSLSQQGASETLFEMRHELELIFAFLPIFISHLEVF